MRHRIVHAFRTYQYEAELDVARWEKNYAGLASRYQVLHWLANRLPGSAQSSTRFQHVTQLRPTHACLDHP